MTDTTNLVLLAKLDIHGALNHKLLMAYYFVPKALAMKIIYRTFLKWLAQGRKIKRDAITEMAEGPIWMDSDTFQIGLFGFCE
jgi:hypothetical protein